MQVYSTTDEAVLKRNFQFLRDTEADEKVKDENWEIRMSIKYYNQLFKEYALADLTRYKQGQVGLRWRTKSEVMRGKGQFICGNKRCPSNQDLHSYELLFAYMEQNERKRCLVKVRVCPECALKLFYKKTRKKDRKRLIQPEDIHGYVSSVRDPVPSSSQDQDRDRDRAGYLAELMP